MRFSKVENTGRGWFLVGVVDGVSCYARRRSDREADIRLERGDGAVFMFKWDRRHRVLALPHGFRNSPDNKPGLLGSVCNLLNGCDFSKEARHGQTD